MKEKVDTNHTLAQRRLATDWFTTSATCSTTPVPAVGRGKRVAISGSGNVAQYAALKCIELGATVVSLSDSKGTLVVEDGQVVTPEDVEAIADLKVKRRVSDDLRSQRSVQVHRRRPALGARRQGRRSLAVCDAERGQQGGGRGVGGGRC